MKGWLKRNWFWLAVNVAATIPLLWLGWDIWRGNLSVNPIDDLTDRTGKAAIILLGLSLACTPANILFGWRQPLQVRKALGMFAFVYASLHLLNFVGLDYGFDVHFLLADGLVTKPYIVVGLLSFLLLVPLAITSSKSWMKRLGQAWKRLHRLAYVAAGAAVVHFLWLAKAAEDFEPLLYGAVLGVLLLVRLPPIRARIVHLRSGLSAKGRIVPVPASPRSER